MSKILIAVPTYENIFPDTFKSIYALKKGDNEVFFDFARGYDVANARNKIASMTLDGGFDYVLMVDNDIVLPEHSLLNMLESERAFEFSHSMVVGYYTKRKSVSDKFKLTTAYKFGGKDYDAKDAYLADEIKDFRDKGIVTFQIRGSGLGCALIHREIFEIMKYPFFRWTEYSNKGQLSEDLYFCEKFREINRPIFLNTKAACGHMIRFVDR